MKNALRLCMVGCSHRHTSLAVRERLAFSDTQTADALAAWRVAHPGVEAALLSTCNRVELYSASEDLAVELGSEPMTRHLAEFHNVPLQDIENQLVTLDDEAVVEHLFRVAASLDSMVIGEPQILSQVKNTYTIANSIGSAGPITHTLFQSALRAARRVASETSLHRHRVSIPSVAIADFASRIFEQFDDKQVLLIGAGEMAGETLKYLIDAGAKNIVLVNRDSGRAERLAARWQGRAAAWDNLFPELAAADLVVSTTGSDRPVVSLDDFHQHVAPSRDQRPLFVLDLAVPRDFEQAIGHEVGVYLYGIDNLSEACERNRHQRAQELPAADLIIQEETRRFILHARHRAAVPVIAQIRDSLKTTQNAELERLFQKLPDLDERSRREIEQFADRLLKKMLHPPLESLRNESSTGSPHRLLEAIERLFRINK